MADSLIEGVKACKRCGDIKPQEAFARNTSNSQLRTNLCKACHAKTAYARYLIVRDSEAYKLRERDRGRRHYHLHRAECMAQRKARGYKSGQCRTFAKRKAGYDLRNAVASGRIIKPLSCEKCGAGCRPQGHHEDYGKPYEVRWLCQPCHAKAHRKIGWSDVSAHQ